MKYLKINSKKLQNLDNGYILVDYNDGFDNKFVFRRTILGIDTKYLHLQAPKGTINAILLDNVWYWEILEKGESI